MKEVSFVTGATGSIGLVLVKELVSRGQDVIALVRSKEKGRSLPGGVECVIGDINRLRREDIKKDRIDYVFHLAAISGDNRCSSEDPWAFRQVNVEGTRNIAGIAKQVGAKRFVHFSTIDVYGKEIVSPADESHEIKPVTLYGETKAMAETVVQEEFCTTTGETGATILRLAAVYGPNMKGNYPRLVKALKERRFLPIGRGNNKRTLLYEKDAVNAAILAARHPAAKGRTYNVSDGEMHTVNEIIMAICEALDRRPPAIYVPEGVAIFSAKMADRMLSVVGKNVHLAEAVRKYTANVAVDSELIMKDLGFLPEYDLKTGWQETIEEWASRGMI